MTPTPDIKHVATMYDGILIAKGSSLSIDYVGTVMSIIPRSGDQSILRELLRTRPEVLEDDRILLTCYQFSMTNDFVEAALILRELFKKGTSATQAASFCDIDVSSLLRLLRDNSRDWQDMSPGKLLKTLGGLIRVHLRIVWTSENTDVFSIKLTPDECDDVVNALDNLTDIISKVPEACLSPANKHCLAMTAKSTEIFYQLMYQAANNAGITILLDTLYQSSKSTRAAANQVIQKDINLKERYE